MPTFIELKEDDYVLLSESSNILIAIKKDEINNFIKEYEEYQDFIEQVKEFLIFHKDNDFKNYIDF